MSLGLNGLISASHSPHRPRRSSRFSNVPCPVSSPFPFPLKLPRAASRAGRRRPFQNLRYRAVHFTFQGAQLVFDVLRLSQLAGPPARG